MKEHIRLLNTALTQTGWKGPVLTKENWRREVLKKLKSLDWDKAREDVRPFLERERDLDLVTAETIGQLLVKRSS